MKGFVNFNGDLRSTWNKSRINFLAELGELDRKMLRDCWKSFILLLVKKKKIEEQFRHCVSLVGIFPTRFDDFIEQTGRTAFTSHILYDGSKNRCYR